MHGVPSRAAAQAPFASRLALRADVAAPGFQAQGAAHVAQVRVARACLDLHAVGGDPLKLGVAAASPHADVAADGSEAHVAGAGLGVDRPANPFDGQVTRSGLTVELRLGGNRQLVVDRDVPAQVSIFHAADSNVV